MGVRFSQKEGSKSETTPIRREIYERHRILNELLLSIGVPAPVAEQDACRIEHVISKETLEKVKSLCTQRGAEMLAAQPITA